MGREIGQKCMRNKLSVSRFSIFYCGCKQPKSIHICFRLQSYENNWTLDIEH